MNSGDFNDGIWIIVEDWSTEPAAFIRERSRPGIVHVKIYVSSNFELSGIHTWKSRNGDGVSLQKSNSNPNSLCITVPPPLSSTGRFHRNSFALQCTVRLRHHRNSLEFSSVHSCVFLSLLDTPRPWRRKVAHQLEKKWASSKRVRPYVSWKKEGGRP